MQRYSVWYGEDDMDYPLFSFSWTSFMVKFPRNRKNAGKIVYEVQFMAFSRPFFPFCNPFRLVFFNVDIPEGEQEVRGNVSGTVSGGSSQRRQEVPKGFWAARFVACRQSPVRWKGLRPGSFVSM